MNNIRLRFAPSPTGFLHIGGLRTVLFAYAIAKSLDGKLVLRIEDTDQKRTVEGAVEKLIEAIEWSGVEFDESPVIGGDYGPYVQTERLKIYEKYKKELLDKEEAYHCFCTTERLDEMRKKQEENKQAPRYDRCCRDLTKEEVDKRIGAGESYVIRQKMPLTGEVKIIDELRGEIVFNAEDLDDHVLIKSDGIPTYQFASVVDDHLMEISHITRGEEWIASFPKNVLLYKSFGWDIPKFIHLPLILNKEGGKLSKRQNDVAVEDYIKKGYLPEAVVNFCILLGWHPKGDNEILSMEDIIKEFKIKDVGVSAAVFDIDKLDFFNGYYIRQMDSDKLVELCKPYLPESDKLKEIVALEQERLKKITDIAELTKFFFVEELEYDKELLLWKKLTIEDVKENLTKLIIVLEGIEDWTTQNLNDVIIKFIKDNEFKVGDFLWPMRVALTGEKASPGPFEVASVLGKEESLRRIKSVI